MIQSIIDSDKGLKRLTATDFEETLNDVLSAYVKCKLEEYDFCYYDLTLMERDAWIRKIVNVLLALNIEEAGEHRLEQWEKGWEENLTEFEASSRVEAVIPGYFGKYNVIRWKQKLIKPAHIDFERNSLSIIQDWLFDKYMRNAATVYEFGCGTGHNLFRVRNVNPNAKIWGLDWATSSQKIIQKLVRDGVDRNLFAHRFNLFHPDEDFNLEGDSIVYTVASLEQLGTRYKKFLKYLIKQRPSLCIHIEPVAELLDENNLLDYLSIQYFIKRKYLSGYLDHLRQLEKQGQLKILRAQRTYIGSLFIEGYSVIVWSPGSRGV